MIYILLADGFEEIEALETLDIMRRADLSVQTVGVNDEVVTGSHNIPVVADIMLDDLVAGAMDMLILPGGPGHKLLDDDDRVHALINYCMKYDKYIAAICAAPSILGKRGITKGKKVTCFPEYEQYMTGADVTGEKVVCDGKLITARGAGAASDFGFKIVELMRGKKIADDLKSAMQY